MGSLLDELAKEATRGLNGQGGEIQAVTQSQIFCHMVHPKTGVVVQLIADPQVILVSLMKGFVLVLNTQTGLRAKLVCGYDLVPDKFEEKNERQGIRGEDKDTELQSKGENTGEECSCDDCGDEQRSTVPDDSSSRSSRKPRTPRRTNRKCSGKVRPKK